MKTVTVISRKGGTGKTTTCQNLGAGLQRKGYKVLFIDLDSQCNLTFSVGANLQNLNAMDVLTGKAEAAQAIQTTEAGQAIISAGSKLANADLVFTETGREYRLKEALQPIAKQFDFCLIDTAGALNVLAMNALTASDGIVIPVQADIYSLQGIAMLNDPIETVKKYTNKALQIYGILLTRYNSRSVLSKDMKENLRATAKQLGTRLYETAIRGNISLREAQFMKRDIFSYAPKSHGAEDYKAFTDEFLKDIGE